MTEFIEQKPTEETEVSSDESITTETEDKITPPPLPESRTRKILRNIFRWTISLLIAFCLGALVIYFAFLIPTQANLEKNIVELDQVTQQVDSLTKQLDESMQTNQELESKLFDQQAHFLLLSTISDVRATNLALINDDYAGALLSMRDASQYLTQLDESIGEDQGEVLIALQNNLKEIEAILKSDPETAKMNLDRLIANLIKLENNVYK